MVTRRNFLKSTAVAALGASLQPAFSRNRPAIDSPSNMKPNILYVFSDQWRECDHGYSGNPDVQTPNIDRLSRECVNFSNAVSGIPVCCPHRACLVTGKYPLTHGLFLNDLSLSTDHRSIAHCLNDAGYTTGWIGKWHIDGQGREAFTPPERRQGFHYWRTLECTHDYNHSTYFADTPDRLYWEGYDAIAQTRNAREFLTHHVAAGSGAPFALFLSWGPPHAPYHTAPKTYREVYANRELTLRPNVPAGSREQALRDYRGYYAHMTALDDCMGDLLQTLEETGLAENTILVYTSDHGDMMHSRGAMKKQQPWEESLRVPFLLRWPEKLGRRPREIAMPLNTPDIMPTLLGLAEVDIPDEVEGIDRSAIVLGTDAPEEDHAALTLCIVPFGQWTRDVGGREYRGVRTARYTYCRDLNGPWLLYDNEADPYQMDNLVNRSSHAKIQARLEVQLNDLLEKTHDAFLPSGELIRRCGYVVRASDETVDYDAPFNPANITRSPR